MVYKTKSVIKIWGNKTIGINILKLTDTAGVN